MRRHDDSLAGCPFDIADTASFNGFQSNREFSSSTSGISLPGTPFPISQIPGYRGVLDDIRQTVCYGVLKELCASTLRANHQKILIRAQGLVARGKLLPALLLVIEEAPTPCLAFYVCHGGEVERRVVDTADVPALLPLFNPYLPSLREEATDLPMFFVTVVGASGVGQYIVDAPLNDGPSPFTATSAKDSQLRAKVYRAFDVLERYVGG